jgi:hypothetical protein
MDLVVRDAGPDDAAAILRVFNPIIRSGRYTVFDQELTEDVERRYIADLPPRGIFHVALRVSDQVIVGFQVRSRSCS